MDPLASRETARAALDLYYQHRPKKPVVAVIYSHSHVDHYGGVRGVVSEADVRTGTVKVIAPEHFTAEAVSENVLAGNAMRRRALYMFGRLLPPGPQGQASSGLGLTISGGAVTFIPPTDSVTRTGQKLTIDGLTYEFQMAPGTEAPAEMHFFIHEYRALCPAENATHTLHNLYTLRGAKVRDAKAWAFYLNECLELFGDKAEVEFAPHHWPLWGNQRIREHLAKMRDTFKYLHDQALRLANHGYTATEIGEMMELPPSLQANWASRGYWGSVNQNAKSVYNFYLGWFDGNPATLHALPPAGAARKYVAYMGGVAAVLAKARGDFEKGEYRWVAQAVNHVVLADPTNQAARRLLADTYEQLGYQAESGPWRNFYLTGATELRHGVWKSPAAGRASSDTIRAMPLDVLIDYLAVRLNGSRADGKTAVVNIDVTDTRERYVLVLGNSVLNYHKNRQDPKADCTASLTRTDLNEIILGQAKLPRLVADGKVKIVGDPQKLRELLSLLDSFEPWFDVVTTNPPPRN